MYPTVTLFTTIVIWPLYFVSFFSFNNCGAIYPFYTMIQLKDACLIYWAYSACCSVLALAVIIPCQPLSPLIARTSANEVLCFRTFSPTRDGAVSLVQPNFLDSGELSLGFPSYLPWVLYTNVSPFLSRLDSSQLKSWSSEIILTRPRTRFTKWRKRRSLKIKTYVASRREMKTKYTMSSRRCG